MPSRSEADVLADLESAGQDPRIASVFERLGKFFAEGRYGAIALLADQALRAFPEHVGLKAVKGVAETLQGGPRAIAGFAQLLKTGRPDGLELGITSSVVRKGLAASVKQESETRLRAVETQIRSTALDQLDILKNRIARDLIEPGLKRAQVRQLRRETRGLVQCFSDPQSPPAARAASHSVRQAASELARFRRLRQIGLSILIPVSVVAFYLTFRFFASTPPTLEAVLLTLFLVGGVGAYLTVLFSRDSARRFAWRAVGGFEKHQRELLT